MKARNVVMTAVGFIGGVAFCFGLAILAANLVMPQDGGRRVAKAQRPVLEVAENNVPPAPFFFDLEEAFPNAPAAQPVTREEAQAARGPVVAASDYKLSGPFTHGNLSVFLIHGPDMLKEQKVVTLQEAIARNQAVVHETGMGQLFIDNNGTAPLFIQAGDIVKGGTQDRTLPYDQLIPAATRRHPLPALCVEQGRSRPRGNEISTSFSSSTEQLPGKRLKMAAFQNAQGAVWSNVANLQANLTRNVGDSVKAPQSQTSLQLTLENQRLQQVMGEYLQELAGAPEGKNDVIGFAVAVNGKLQVADVYASSALFNNLWPKLLKASVVDAIAEQAPGAAAEAPSSDAVLGVLVDAEKGQAFRQSATSQTNVIRLEGQNLLYDTCIPNQGNLVLHRTFLVR